MQLCHVVTTSWLTMTGHETLWVAVCQLLLTEALD